MPETELIKNDDGTYCIKQKYIEGKLLNSIDINQLDEQVLSDLLELYDGCVAYCKNEGTLIDIMGYQEDIYNVENIRKRRFLHYSRLFNNFFSSTNIIISNDNKVYMIDVCDTVPVQKNSQELHRIKKAVKQAIVKLGIKKAEFKIRHIIKGKREELLDAIS